MADADALALRVTTEPDSAIVGYGLARESFDRVLQDDATHAEAIEARRRIEEQLRELAVRVERAREVERELGLLLEGARTAIAEVEIAGGARAATSGRARRFSKTRTSRWTGSSPSTPGTATPFPYGRASRRFAPKC